MRFLADMGLGLEVVRWLRAQGHDVAHLRDEGLHRMLNGEIFAKAVSERRVILTFDLDFSEIAALSKRPSVGVIVFRLRNTRSSHVIERLSRVVEHSMRALERGAVVSVEESRHRIRYLPIGAEG